ncbi:MAG: hypothetical protein LBN27_02965, partial [Prevotellaceae bacterium]|nr:hypothetical protein [Prevotellaceae bacterium]
GIAGHTSASLSNQARNDGKLNFPTLNRIYHIHRCPFQLTASVIIRLRLPSIIAHTCANLGYNNK